MSVINTNYLSLVAQNNLQKSQSSLGTAIERLSSGLRINSAKDDAAGQAIANRMGAQINGLTQAARNANDGISAAQTTEGALNQINDNLQRIRVLTVQATNGTNSGKDLDSIQNEITQRLDEINRISEQTDFNGVKVLASDQTLNIQVGANDGQTISINLQKIDVAKLNLTGFNVNDADVKNTAASLTDLTGKGFTADAANSTATSSAYTKSVNNVAATGSNVFAAMQNGDTVNYTGTDTGFNVAATAGTYTYNSTSDSYSFDAAGVANADVVANLTPDAGLTTSATIDIGGTSVDVVIKSDKSIYAADGTTALYLDSTGNLTQNTAGAPPAATLDNLTASMGVSGNGTGGTITVGATSYTSTGLADTFDVTGASISGSALQNLAKSNGTYDVTLDNSGSPVTYNVAGGAVTTGAAAVYVDTAGALSTSATTDTTYFVQNDGSVTDGAGAKVYVDSAGALTMQDVQAGTRTDKPLDVLDAALAQVDSMRSDLGAIQNRFESAITNLNTTSNNLAAAQSRIQDADYSVEVANMTRAQILQQAGTSVLAQANQIPQGVLSLLR